MCIRWASQVVLMVKNPTVDAGDVRAMGLIPGLGRSLGGGHANPLQYSCLQNPMDRGALRATVHGRKESDMTEVTQHAHSMSVSVNPKLLQKWWLLMQQES